MLKRAVFILLVCVLFFEGDMADVTLINEVVPVNKYGMAAPYACMVDDKRIYVSTAPSKMFWENGGALAVAVNSEQHGRAILVDEENFFNSYLTPEFQHFVLAHECAHHTLGHQDKNSAYNGSKNKKPSESAADCQAIQRLVDRGFGQLQFDIILGQIGDTSEEMGYLINVNESARYKAAHGRANDIRACLENINEH